MYNKLETFCREILVQNVLFVLNQYLKRILFFRFSTKESAAHAIVAIHNSDVNGHTVKCSWGKESGDPNNLPANSQV